MTKITSHYWNIVHGHKRFVAAVSTATRVAYKQDVLRQGEPRDAAVNFDTYRILQRQRAVSPPQHGFLLYISTHSKCWNFTQYADFHRRDANEITVHDQNHGKNHGNREDVITLQR